MNKKLLGHLLALFSCCVWGTTFICSKILLQHMTPVTLLLIRFVLGFFALFLLYPKPMPFLGWKKELILLGAGVSGITVYYQLENTALLYADASLVSVIICTAPFFVTICSRLFLRTEKLRRGFIPGLLISTAGICVMSFTGALQQTSLSGVLMAVIAAMSWGFYSVFTKKAEAFGYHTIQTTRRLFLYGTLGMTPFILLDKDFSLDFSLIIQPEILINLLFLGIVASALCFVTWNTGLKHLGTLSSSVYIYLTPVITVAFSVPILHEQLSLQGVIGIILTLLGVIVSEWL